MQKIQTIVFILIRHGYSEHEIEEAVLHRKPVASRALYTLIERRLQEGLGWPDRTYNNSGTAMSSTTVGAATGDGSSDVVILDKLDRHEPLLPGRRAPPQQSTSSMSNPRKLSREKSAYASDEQLLSRANAGGLTQEALSELVPASRLASRKLYHDIVVRKPSAGGSHGDSIDEHIGSRRMINSNSLSPIKPSLITQRNNILTLQQQQKMKPRSLPSSSLDHANQNGFHISHDPHGSRTSKNHSRTSHVENSRKPQQQQQQHSPVRYNHSKLNFLFFFIPWHITVFRTVSTTSCLFRLSLDDTPEDHNNQVLSPFLCCVPFICSYYSCFLYCKPIKCVLLLNVFFYFVKLPYRREGRK
jgi:hypothetical protein